jgi:transposase-like protein
MERRQFTDEFKCEAVRLASQPGISKAGISKDLGINANMLHRWVREQEGDPLNAGSPTSQSTPSEVRFYCSPPPRMAYTHNVPGFGGICQWFLRLV